MGSSNGDFKGTREPPHDERRLPEQSAMGGHAVMRTMRNSALQTKALPGADGTPQCDSHLRLGIFLGNIPTEDMNNYLYSNSYEAV